MSTDRPRPSCLVFEAVPCHFVWLVPSHIDHIGKILFSKSFWERLFLGRLQAAPSKTNISSRCIQGDQERPRNALVAGQFNMTFLGAKLEPKHTDRSRSSARTKVICSWTRHTSSQC